MVLPTHIGAERIAEMILYQETARFIRGSERMRDFEKVLQSLGLDIEVVVAAPKSPVIGKTIEAVEQQAQRGVLHRADQPPRRRSDHPAGAASLIGAGDGLVLVGRGGQARAIGGLFEAGGRAAFRVSAR